MPRIYISHRPQDSSHNDIPIIIDLLSEQFGAENIYDTQHATQTIKERQILVKSCDILLVVIGRFWTSMYDETGNNLLFDPYDPVNIEITTGLGTSMVISTVVVDGVDMPTLNDLPETMHDLHKKRIRLSSDETLEVIVTKLMGAWSHIESGTMAREHHIDLQTMQIKELYQQLLENPRLNTDHSTSNYIFVRIDPMIQNQLYQFRNSNIVKRLKAIRHWLKAQLIIHRGFWQGMLVIPIFLLITLFGFLLLGFLVFLINEVILIIQRW